MLLARTRLALRITTTAYDSELASLLLAAAEDLRVVGIPVDGVRLTVAMNNNALTVTDNSTIRDELLIRALITYVRAHFGSPSDYEQLKRAYDEQKAQLRLSSRYGLGEWQQ